MKPKKLLLAVFCLLTTGAFAQDWDGIPVPATPPEGRVWELDSVSDSFNYTSNSSNRGEEFDKRWNELYINGFSGPSATSYHKDHVWTDDGKLVLHAAYDNTLPIIYTGCISSKKAFVYPMFMEAKVKQSNCMLANNVWMISQDETEELDMLESYPNSQTGREWLDARIHLSHHTFIRDPFTDYQPRDEEGVYGTWYNEAGRETWQDDYFRIGVLWKNPHHAEYYINGKWVRTIKKNEHSFLDSLGNVSEHTTTFDALDKYGYTGGTGLSKPQHIIINMEQQEWLSDQGIFPTRDELKDENGQNTYLVDWIRVYNAVPIGGAIPVQDVVLEPQAIVLDPGESFDFDHELIPSNATQEIVTWATSNQTIATINGAGVVTAISQGTVTAEVTTLDGGHKAVATVTVTDAGISPTGVALSPETLTVKLGETEDLDVTITPANVTNKSIIWRSSNPSVATINNGTIIPQRVGTTTISATTLVGRKTATAEVTIVEAGGPVVVVDPTGVSVSPATATIEVGETSSLTATVAPANASNKSVTWSSSDVAIATVSSSGVVTAQAVGTAEITATTVVGSISSSTTITVEDTIVPPVMGDVIVIEAESFTDTYGSFDDSFAGGPGSGASKAANFIEFVNSNDWVEYEVDVPVAGSYAVEYMVSTPSDNAQIRLVVDGTGVATTNVPNNGQWSDFSALAGGTIALTAGQHTIRIIASGSATWQWNMDYIKLTPVSGRSSSKLVNADKLAETLAIYPNPTSGKVFVKGLSKDMSHEVRIYDIKGLQYMETQLSEDHSIDVESLREGIYFLSITNDRMERTILKLVKN